MAEWSNAAVSKTVAQGNLGREFKSHPLRHLRYSCMDSTSAWEKALRETNIIRSRVIGLQTFGETQVPYILLSPSTINEGDTVVRTGEVLVHRPSLILPPNIPQLEGFNFEGEEFF